MHPAVAHLYRFFNYDKMPAHLQAVAKPFHALASSMAELDGPEAAAGLRKLLEARDCFERAVLSRPTTNPGE